MIGVGKHRPKCKTIRRGRDIVPIAPLVKNGDHALAGSVRGSNAAFPKRCWGMTKWLRRLAVSLAGAIIVLLGIVILPFPGPFGAPLVLLGFTVLGSEFEIARKWKERFIGWFVKNKKSQKKTEIG